MIAKQSATQASFPRFASKGKSCMKNFSVLTLVIVCATALYSADDWQSNDSPRSPSALSSPIAKKSHSQQDIEHAKCFEKIIRLLFEEITGHITPLKKKLTAEEFNMCVLAIMPKAQTILPLGILAQIEVSNIQTELSTPISPLTLAPHKFEFHQAKYPFIIAIHFYTPGTIHDDVLIGSIRTITLPGEPLNAFRVERALLAKPDSIEIETIYCGDDAVETFGTRQIMICDDEQTPLLSRDIADSDKELHEG